jgi:hypothetical protein
LPILKPTPAIENFRTAGQASGGSADAIGYAKFYRAGQLSGTASVMIVLFMFIYLVHRSSPLKLEECQETFDIFIFKCGESGKRDVVSSYFGVTALSC